MRRTIRIEVTDTEHSDDPFAPADREQATLMREFAYVAGSPSPAEFVDRIAAFIDTDHDESGEHDNGGDS